MNINVQGTGRRLTDVLIRRGALTADALASAQAEAGTERIERYLVKNRIVNASAMTLAIAEYLALQPISLAHFSVPASLVELLPPDQWVKLQVVPVAKIGKSLTIAVGDPFNLSAVDELRSKTGLSVSPVIASEDEIGEILKKAEAAAKAPAIQMSDIMRSADSDIEVSSTKEEENLEQSLDNADDAPAIKMVNAILIEALRTKASDIHIEVGNPPLLRVHGGKECPWPAR